MANKHLFFLLATVYWAIMGLHSWAITDKLEVRALHDMSNSHMQLKNRKLGDPCGKACFGPSVINLNLSHNFLTGPFGVVFDGLGNLKLMDLSFNSFTSDLPTSFESLTNLIILSPATDLSSKKKSHEAGMAILIGGLVLAAFRALAFIFQRKIFEESNKMLRSCTTIFAIRKANYVILGADSRSTTSEGAVIRDDVVKVRKILDTGLCMAVSGRLSTLNNVQNGVLQRFGGRNAPLRVSRVVNHIVDLLHLEPADDHCSIILGGRARRHRLELVHIRKMVGGVIEVVNDAQFLKAGSGSAYIEDPKVNEINNGDMYDNIKLVMCNIENAITRDSSSGGLVVCLCIKFTRVCRFVWEPGPTGYRTLSYNRVTFEEEKMIWVCGKDQF